MAYPTEKMKDVYTIIKSEGRKDRWVRIGIGFLNRDNSIAVRLDAVPTNGSLHIRDYVRKGEWKSEPEERSSGLDGTSTGAEGALMEGGLS